MHYLAQPLVGAVFHFQFGWIPQTVFWILVGVGVLMALFAMINAHAAIKPIHASALASSNESSAVESEDSEPAAPRHTTRHDPEPRQRLQKLGVEELLRRDRCRR